MPSTNTRTIIAQILSFIYFAFFLAMPFYTKNDVGSEPVPQRLTESTFKRKLQFLLLTALTIVLATVFAMNV